MKMLLIALIALALLAGLVYLPVVFAMASMSPWQLFQHLCATPPPLSVQQQPTTPFCTTNPNDPACLQQLQQQQQQAGPPPDGP